MSSSTESADKKATPKKKTKGSYAVGLLNLAGTATRRAWEDGTLVRTPKELLTQYNPLESSASYSYTALPTDTSIRLLEVSASNPGDLIQCKLHVVDLQDRPKYIALSYSWERDGSWTKFAAGIAGSIAGDGLRHMGIKLPKSEDKDGDADGDSKSKRVMLCDGKRFLIQPNLHDALLQFRRTAPGYYWVDAVCMNQNDNAEKTKQLRMMSDIYRQAESVAIWLGKCPQVLSRGVARFEAAQGNIGPMEGEDEKAGRIKMIGDDSEPHAFLGAAYLLSRRWFGRLWVLQEFCLARRMHIQFGEHHIRPETIVGLIQSFKDLLEGRKSGDEKNSSELGLANLFRPIWGLHIKFVPPLFESRELFQQGMKWSLEEWLQMTRGRSATDTRDFTNASFALVRESSLTIDQSIQLEDAIPSSQSGPRLWPRLHATAEADRFEVFLNLAACLLTQSQSAFLLSLGALGNDPNLPTWMPEPGGSIAGFIEPFVYQKGTDFGACVTSLASPKISPDGRTLYLQAARLGTVEHVFQRKMIFAFNLIDTGDDMIAFLEFAAKIPTEYGPSKESGFDALARTLVVDSMLNGNPVVALTEYLDTEVAMFRRKLDRLSKPKPQPSGVEGYLAQKLDVHRGEPSEGEAKTLATRLDEAWAKLKSLYPDKPWSSFDAKPGQERSSDYRNFVDVGLKVNGWRALFLTKEGRLGLGGFWIKKGEVVMLVESGYVPYVFEPAPVNAKEQVKKATEEMENLRKKPQPLSQKNEKEYKKLEETLNHLQSRMSKQSGAWTLNGEAYVHGVMHGEAMDGSLAFEPIAIN
ncbi:heterokaryon incompatibility protein-domain-containing protein [Xylaria bambusicola]|uniref:heterokaryon incompatibility protein-domain-containing protein n=1 Tax=Xylaria bambusicola TaxID=326684 RepID=UPI0020087E43|nr:heterokaryon incompatibility protein-domain-containing protein [Xylaria bambusicola]KAI0506673.1 heterokaryon incompatibility protein-domain-containing protein [Xylaria bambusicola]